MEESISSQVRSRIFKTYQEFLRSKMWRNLRWKRMRMDNFTCKICGATTGLNAHHILYPRYWEWTKVTHLTTRCINCHNDEHRIRRSVPINEFASPVLDPLPKGKVEITPTDRVDDRGLPIVIVKTHLQKPKKAPRKRPENLPITHKRNLDWMPRKTHWPIKPAFSKAAGYKEPSRP